MARRCALLAGVAALACAGAAQAQAPTEPKTQPKESAVSGVTVSGAKKEIETSIDRRSYSVANDIQGRTGSLADVLRNIPSVQVDVEGNVSLRGDPNVTVLVDGKPSATLTKETLAQVVQSMPAEQIDRIEVITNPSAEFKADGSGGVINLVTKKARGVGKTGSVRLNATSNGSAAASINHGFNSDKLSVSDNLSYRHDTAKLDASDQRTGAGFASQDRLIGDVAQDTVQGRVAADYDMDAKTRLTTSLSGFWQNVEQPIYGTYRQTDGAGATTVDFARLSDQSISGWSGQGDINLRRKYGDAHDINLHAGYGYNNQINDRIDVINQTVPAVVIPAQQFARENTNQSTNLSVDLQQPLSDGVQLKAGYLFEYSDNLVEHVGGAGPTASSIVPIPGLSDDFAESETHSQAYVTLQKGFGKLTALGGLRAETVDIDMNRLTAGVQSEQDYARLYPTLHLDYALAEGRKLTASYSKRVLRPRPIDLDPFVFTQNASVAIAGNPNLVPQETDSYELGFERRKGAASSLITLYYRQTDNAFSFLLTPQANGLLLQSRANLGHQANGGAEFVFANRLTPKLSYNLSFNAYWSQIEAGNLGFPTDREAWTGYGRANLNWQVTSKDFVQINVFANGKQLFPQGYYAPFASGNIGYRRNLSDKLSLMVVVQDPFKTIKNRLVIDSGPVREQRVQQTDSRSVGLTLVWNFAGKPRDTGFDFGPGGGGAAAVP